MTQPEDIKAIWQMTRGGGPPRGLKRFEEAERKSGDWEHLKLGDPPKRGVITATHEDLTTPAEARAALDAFGGLGWVMLTDKVHDITPQRGLSVLTDHAILAAELCRADGRSLHLRQHGAGWRAWTLTREDGDGWIVTHTHMRIPRGVWTYEVAWLPDPDGVYRPQLARLTDTPFQGGSR